jgi:hypothetical protein
MNRNLEVASFNALQQVMRVFAQLNARITRLLRYSRQARTEQARLLALIDQVEDSLVSKTWLSEGERQDILRPLRAYARDREDTQDLFQDGRRTPGMSRRRSSSRVRASSQASS